MRASFIFSVALTTLLAPLAATLGAVVVEQAVTAASVKERNSPFAVKVEQGDDGLIHFTITYRALEQRYLVAHVEVREGEKLLSKTDVPSIVHGRSAVFYVAIAPECLSGSRFELAERSFGLSMDGSAIPLPGGIDYQIRLGDFAGQASKAGS